MARTKYNVFERTKTFNILNPIRNATKDGIFELSSTSLDKYKSNLYTLLFTGIGERVMMPEFGTRIKYLLFDQITEDILVSLRKEIVDQAGYWIPEIVIHKVEYPDIEDDIENNRINLKITFGLKADPDIQDTIEVNIGA